MFEKERNTDNNLAILRDSDLTFSYRSDSKVVLIRDDGLSIDFYPTTNKWKDNLRKNKITNGDANKLIMYIKNYSNISLSKMRLRELLKQAFLAGQGDPNGTAARYNSANAYADRVLESIKDGDI